MVVYIRALDKLFFQGVIHPLIFNAMLIFKIECLKIKMCALTATMTTKMYIMSKKKPLPQMTKHVTFFTQSMFTYNRLY